MHISNPLILCISFVLFFGTCVNAAGNCTTFADQDSCCTNGCIYAVCATTVGNTTTNQTGCYEQGWTSTGTCENGTQTVQCNGTGSSTTQAPETPTQAPPTTAAPDVCAGNTNKTTCCAAAGCDFIQCTSTNASITDPVEVCHTKDANVSAICQEPTVKPICDEATTTPKPPATTQAPSGTTPAPGSDPCEAFANNATLCCEKVDLKCMFIACQAIDKTPHFGCHINTTDLTGTCTDNTMTSFCSADAWTPKACASTSDLEKGQHFDGPSFIGGIVLSIGIVAVLFFAFKFYKARAEKNYHTL